MRPGLQGLKAIIPGGGPTQYLYSYGMCNVPSWNLPTQWNILFEVRRHGRH